MYVGFLRKEQNQQQKAMFDDREAYYDPISVSKRHKGVAPFFYLAVAQNDV